MQKDKQALIVNHEWLKAHLLRKRCKPSLLSSSFLRLKFPFWFVWHAFVYFWLLLDIPSILDCKNFYQTCKSQGTSQHKHPSYTITFALANLGFPLIFLACALLPVHVNFLSSFCLHGIDARKKVSTVDRYSVSKQGGEAVSKDQLRI